MTKCIYCHVELNSEALFCRDCNHYQTKWRNWLPYLGGGVALLSFLLALAAYAIQPLQNKLLHLIGEDVIDIVSFNSFEGITVKNAGDADVYLESIYFKSLKGVSSGGQYISTPAKKGEFTTVKWSNPNATQRVLKKGEDTSEYDVERVFVTNNDHSFLVYKRALGESMITFQCEASLKYYSLIRDAFKEEKIPCIGFYYKASANKAN